MGFPMALHAAGDIDTFARDYSHFLREQTHNNSEETRKTENLSTLFSALCLPLANLASTLLYEKMKNCPLPQSFCEQITLLNVCGSGNNFLT